MLVSPAGELLGMLPPVELAVPYWRESADLVAEVAARFGVRVVVLRLLWTELPCEPGGRVTYLAELESGSPNVKLLAIPDLLRQRAQQPDERRMPWAEIGGPARSLAWARAALEPGGQASFRAVQQRTWNLSSIWRLEPASVAGARIWLKQAPGFMNEHTVLGWLNRTLPGSAPTLLASDDSGRSLLADVAGDDLYGAPVAVRQLIHAELHAIQRAALNATDELLALGIPDLRGERRAADVRRKLLAWSPDYPGLDALLHEHDQRLERLEECGLPATLVHADNHPGNARGSSQSVTLLDWGEAFVGNPVTDLLGLIGGLSSTEAAPLVAHWCASWKQLAPLSKPELALELAPFIAALHGAATFAHFLQHIEASEWPYHSEDVPRCLEAAKRTLTSAGSISVS